MTDIVERLRNGEPCAACWGDTDGTCKVKNAQSGCTCAEAADTITTLRAELASQVQWVKDLADSLIAEEAKTVTLRADNERMRAALRWFVDEYDKVHPMRQARMHNPGCRCVLCAYDNARAALAQEKPND